MVKVSQGQQNRYFLYDYLGRLIRVRQPEQEVNAALDLTDLVTNNNQWTAGFEYDIVGNLKKTTDAKGSIITNSYDKAGRVTERTYNDPNTPSVNYYYDGTGLGVIPQYSKGKLTKVMSSISTTQYTSFDNFGRNLVSEQITQVGTTSNDYQTYTSKYKYDFGGRMVEQTYPSGKVVRNFFENDGDLAKVVRNGKTYVSDFSYNASGGINSLKLGNGRWETAQFNSRQQMTQIGLGSNATANDLWKLEFKYGELAANGVDVDTSKNTGSIAKQIITLPNVAFTQTYKYDALERLTEAKEVSTGNQTTWQQSWSYDRFGNRLSFNSQGVGLATINTTPAVNPNTNRFTSTDYQYDKAGNITKDISNGLVREFIFNGDNKQIHVKDANNVAIGTYYYDGNGARVKKTTANETTIFVYDGDGILVAEYSTATPTSTPTTSYTTSDHLGSPRVITDKQGNVTSRRDFLPFGEELNAEGTYRTPANKFSAYGVDNIRKRFTGYEKDDETQLDFAEARYYNNKHGRFTAVDPLLASGKSSNPQTFNRYVYCLNNPINCVDPTGLDGVWGYRDVNGGTETKFFNSAEEMNATNSSGEGTDFCRDNPSACVKWNTWTRGDFMVYADRTAERLNSDGTKTAFSLIALDQKTWDRTVAEFWGEGISKDISSMFQDMANHSDMQSRQAEDSQTMHPRSFGAFPKYAGFKAREFIFGEAAPPTNRLAGGSIRNVNPQNGTLNCGNCAVATDATLAGRPASALNGGLTTVRDLQNTFKSRFVQMTQDQITTHLTESGSGARGIIFGNRGLRTPGHYFNGVNQNGTVRFLDGQTGTPANWTPATRYRNFYFMRTDQ
jgi:RHS repeat-associated protein